MSRKPTRRTPTTVEQHVARELDEIVADPNSGLTILERLAAPPSGHPQVTITLDTSTIPRSTSAIRRFPILPLNNSEEFAIILDEYPSRPPHVIVEHLRWVAFPHVMGGFELCLYLDPSREWDPRMTIRDLLKRLWTWLEDAAAGRFDAETSLYHAVGGFLHTNVHAPTLVVRSLNRAGPRLALVKDRTEHRVDLHDDPPSDRANERSALVMPLPSPLHLGSGTTYGRLVAAIETSEQIHSLLHPAFSAAPPACIGLPTPPPWVLPHLQPRIPHPGSAAVRAFTTALEAMAKHSWQQPLLTVVLEVPHPTSAVPSVLGFRIPTLAVVNRREDAPIEWLRISDDRTAVTTRRDHRRPVHALHDKTVVLVGCGGIGSWIGEFVARAGARAVTLLDPATISGGLLTRQNYIEDDVGATKADALARRLRTLCDDIEINQDPSHLGSCDLIIDATVSRSLTSQWTSLRAQGVRLPMIAQVSTDTLSGSLGLVTICPPGSTLDPEEIDEQVGTQVQGNAELEPFNVFWMDTHTADALVPTLGCSVPTYHGSAADLAAIASVALDFIARHLSSPVAGAHLFALPHSGINPAHRFLRIP